MAWLIPTHFRRRVFELSPDFLQQQGIAGLLLDVDNTLTLDNSPKVEREVTAWIEQMRAHHIRLVLISNNTNKRIAPLAKALDIPFVASAKKPMRRGVLRCLELLDLKKEQVALVGDQIFTDVLAGNRMGITTVLLEPFSNNEWWVIRLKRLLEGPIVARAKRKAGRV